MTPETFWKFDAGNLFTIISLLFAFYTAHTANSRRIKKDAEDFQDIKTKVDMIYHWFINQGHGRNVDS
jgi:hypothetical protein